MTVTYCLKTFFLIDNLVVTTPAGFCSNGGHPSIISQSCGDGQVWLKTKKYFTIISGQ